MAATVYIYSYHGSTPSGASVTSVRFKEADNDTADLNNRIPIPATGTTYSFIKQLALYAATSPATLIDTLQAYSSGSLPTGIQMYMANETAYTDPTVQQSTAVTGWTNNYTTYTSSNPLNMPGSISNPNTGKINSGYLLMQMGVTSSAAAGTIAAQTLTMSYLES